MPSSAEARDTNVGKDTSCRETHDGSASCACDLAFLAAFAAFFLAFLVIGTASVLASSIDAGVPGVEGPGLSVSGWSGLFALLLVEASR